MATPSEWEQHNRLVDALTPYIQSAMVESFIPATDYNGSDDAPFQRSDPALILRRVLVATDKNTQAMPIPTETAQVFANLGVWLHRAIRFGSHPSDMLGRLLAHVFSRAIPDQSRLIHAHVQRLDISRNFQYVQHVEPDFKIGDYVSEETIAAALTNAIPEMAVEVASTIFEVSDSTRQLAVRCACKKALENQTATEPRGEAQTLAEET